MIEQGSKEWHEQRLGKITASRIADLMAKTKSGYGASRKNYLAQLVIERLTGQPVETYQNAAMSWGIETEPEARSTYELFTGNEVALAEFVQHPNIPDAGASPDGYIGDDGLIEIKCPNSSTHIETLLSQSVEGKYNLQVQFQLACTVRGWCDFVSYDPRVPADLSIFIKRIDRDDKLIEQIEKEIQTALIEINETIEKLNAIKETN